MINNYEFLKNMDIPEFPSWRGSDLRYPPTSEMLSEIPNLICCLRNSDSTQEFQTKVENLKIQYILSSNVGESEGTQTLETTKDAIAIKNDKVIPNEKQQVSINLAEAIDHLKIRNFENDIAEGLLDIEECIQDTHVKLMKNLLDETKQGKFSSNLRIAVKANVDAHRCYLKFCSENCVYNCLERKVDTYNAFIEKTKTSNMNEVEKISMYFRCAAYILFHFVNIHPFADGNGRMCRVLASHCLYLVFPFPCPIYNISAPTNKDDYVNAIKEAESLCKNEAKELGCPECDPYGETESVGDLVALLVEAGWHTAKDMHKCVAVDLGRCIC